MPNPDATISKQGANARLSRPADESAISILLEECRRHLARVLPEELSTAVADGALIVDIRPRDQRDRDGEMPDALVIDRNVLEWRLDPTSPDRLPEATDAQRQIIIVCNEGYSSSLAARVLQQLGLVNATDLQGGFQEWSRFEDRHQAQHTGTVRDWCGPNRPTRR